MNAALTLMSEAACLIVRVITRSETVEEYEA
jgi:hypothetical protein